MHLQQPTLDVHQGRILAQAWPIHLPIPHGMQTSTLGLVGPARMRWRLRKILSEARISYHDRTLAPAVPRDRPAHQASHATAEVTPPGLTQALRSANHRGIVIGHSAATHLAIVRHLTQHATTPPLVLVADSATAHRWQQSLRLEATTPPATILSAPRAARDMHWLGKRHDVLFVDSLERMPSTPLDHALDQCAAIARIGFAGRIAARDTERWSTRLGPVVAITSNPTTSRCEQLLVPMPTEIEQRYEAAWSTFLAAFDRFVAVRGDAGFGTFVQQARKDPSQRVALRAWHEAVHCAAWHANKSVLVRELLEQHRGQRVLLFTPDRSSAYEISQEHLIPAITSELPLRERASLLDAFASGAVRALTGPRLLDTGVAEHSADVGVLVGGGFGAAQRASRCQRVRSGGVVFELISQTTLEVGRAHRWRPATADQAAIVHKR